MKSITGVVTAWLIQKEAIEESERELYEYAVYSLFLLMAPLILAIGIGYFFGEFKKSIILILPFMFIRKYSGGYHAKSQGRCLALSSLLLVLCFWIAEQLIPNAVLLVVVLLATVSLSVFSPVDSENRRLTEAECIAYRKASRIIVMLFVILYMLLVAIKAYSYAVYLAMGVILSAGLQIPCILQRVIRKK